VYFQSIIILASCLYINILDTKNFLEHCELYTAALQKKNHQKKHFSAKKELKCTFSSRFKV